MNTHNIHIDWEDPFPIEKLSEFNDEDKDYGVYRTYSIRPNLCTRNS